MTANKNQEIERKYLVIKTKWDEVIKVYGTKIVQYYLSDNPTVRIRIAGLQAFITIKGPTKGVSRPEFEYQIPREDAEEMMSLSIFNTVEKTRYNIFYDGQLFEVDVFEGQNEGLVLAEIELNSEDQDINLPDWISCEVSDDKRYYNSNLAEHPYKDWK